MCSSHSHRSAETKRGVTLVEILVAVAVVAVLAAILLPVFARAYRSSKVSVDVSNLRQIDVAKNLYAADYNDRFIPSAGFLSANGYCSQDVVVSSLDITEEGIGNIYKMMHAWRGGAISGPWPMRVSYHGLYENFPGNWFEHAERFAFAMQEKSGYDGWLVSLSGGEIRVYEAGFLPDIPISMAFHHGHFLRLTYAGSIVHRQLAYGSRYIHGDLTVAETVGYFSDNASGLVDGG